MVAAAYRAAWNVEREPDAAPPQVARTSDVVEAAPTPTTIRKRRQRANEKARKAQIEMFSDGVTSTVTGVTSDRDIQKTAPPQVSPLREISNPLSSPTEEVGGGGDARDAPLVLVTQEAISIADEIIVMVGHDPEFIPPGWCGLAMQVQAWLAHWTRDEIIAGIRAGMAGKRDGPPETPRYFEKPIARVHLRLVTPTSTAAEDSYAQIRASRPAGGWQESRDAFRTARAKLHERVVAFSGSGS